MKKIYTFLTISILSAIITFNGCEKPMIPKTFPSAKPCPGLSELEHAGEIYPTIQIGNQCWLTKSLNLGKQLNHLNESTDNDTIEKYCFYNQSKNCEIYGGLYKWGDVMKYAPKEGGQGICPDGWHIPSTDDFMELYLYVDGCSLYLLSNDSLFGSESSNNCVGCIGKTGFELLLSGSMHPDNESDPFRMSKEIANLWVSSYGVANISRNSFSIRSINEINNNAYGVRCIKDQ